eukprot:TRINITY_DN30547_c0_g1_i1.p1 TRINITY_DN30547_c0_g1~~TRINITY_DN30547_c0_g1_i1.p1  ORF type:complete len:724 (+),score=171.70 TRINITY_DN30547_c0_g1_i1:144-2315(+)
MSGSPEDETPPVTTPRKSIGVTPADGASKVKKAMPSIKAKVAKPAQFLAKIRVEDIRQAELKVEDRRKIVRQAESRLENRKAELDKREAIVEVCEKRARIIAQKREELRNQEKDLSERESAYLALEKQQLSVEDESTHLQLDATLMDIVEENMATSDSQFERKLRELKRDQNTKLRANQRLEGEIERLQKEVTNLKQEVEQNMNAATSTSAALVSTIEAREAEVVEQQQQISQVRAVLDTRKASLKELEEKWTATDKFLKDKYTHIEKTKRELKWSEDSYTIKRKSLRDLHDEYYKCKYSLEEVHADFLKTVTLLEKNKISIEQEVMKRRDTAHELEHQRSDLTEQSKVLKEFEKSKIETRQRLLEEEQSLQKDLEGLQGKTSAATEAIRKLHLWKKEVSEMEVEVTKQRKKLLGKEDEMTDWFRSLSWLGVQNSNQSIPLPSSMGASSKPSFQKDYALEAVDLVPGLVRSHTRQTRLAYLASSCIQRAQPKSKSMLKSKTTSDTNELSNKIASTSKIFINAMSRLRFDSNDTPSQQAQQFTASEKRFLKDCLHHETLLKDSLHLPRLLLRCPLSGGDGPLEQSRVLTNSLKAWWAVIASHASARELRILAARETLLREIESSQKEKRKIVSDIAIDQSQLQQEPREERELIFETKSVSADVPVAPSPDRRVRYKPKTSTRLPLSTVNCHLALPPSLTDHYLPVFPGQETTAPLTESTSISHY